jgi:branched-chain amino acid transport system permease protein
VYRPLRSLGVHHINLVISTLGVSIVLQNVARLVWGSEPISYPPLLGSKGLDLGGIVISVQLIAIISVSAAFMVGLQLFFRFTRLGLAMQAAAQDPDTARLMGISVRRTTTITFTISGAMAGAGGVLLGSLFFSSFNMGFITGIKGFVAATLGGLGSVTGAMFGGLLFGLIETYAGMFISTSYKDAVGMVVLILILLLVPEGLFGRVDRKV